MNPTATASCNAVNALHQLVETNGRRLAYRSICRGQLIVPCARFRGNMDLWDPVENWYARNQQRPTLHLHTFPQAGHGPHYQYPRARASHIATFVRNAGQRP